MALNRVLASVLTEVGPLDRPVLVGAALVIAAAALLARVVPAVSAARLDPAVALKAD